jgi:predicted dehydrogenase
MAKKIKIAAFGCGFWSQFQIGGWQELPGVEIVALYNRTLKKAEDLAQRFHISHYYDDAELLLKNHAVDVVDIITDVDTHRKFVEMAACYGKHVITQKPMAPSLEDATAMMQATKKAGVKYYCHENYRWQPQFRRVKEIIDSGTIGKPYRCKTGFNTAFPLFETQPFLAELEQFALTDQGSHQFDVLRFMFGEPEYLYCITQQINPTIKGEDVATTLIKMKSGVVCEQEISFSSRLEREVFPQTLMLIEGSEGSVKVEPDFVIKTTTKEGTHTETIKIPRYSWDHPRLSVEPPSIVACNNNILQDILGKGRAETTGDDNFRTVQMVFDAYRSARDNEIIFYRAN